MSTIMLPEGSEMGISAPMAPLWVPQSTPQSRARLVRRLLSRPSFHLGDAGGIPITTRDGQTAAVVHFPYKIFDHFLRDVEIRDHAVAQGRTAMMLAGVLPSMRLASSPKATGSQVSRLIATTDGSFNTIPAL